MKSVAASILTGLIVQQCFATPSITDVTVQQRHPWDGKVDITYTATGDIPATAREQGLITSLQVTATDQETETTYTATSLSGDAALHGNYLQLRKRREQELYVEQKHLVT